MTDSSLHECPVCGYVGLSRPAYLNYADHLATGNELPPYGNYLGEPSYQVCASCGYEFGNDDEPGGGLKGYSFEEHRSRWLGQGAEPFGVLAEGSFCDIAFPSRRIH